MEKVQKKKLTRTFVVVIAVLVVMAVLMFLAIVGFSKETSSRQLLYEGPEMTGDYLEAGLRVISIDLNKRQVVARLLIAPQGNLANATGFLTEDLTIYVYPATKDQSRTYRAGDYIGPMDIDVDTSGEVAMYPWDEHGCLVEILALKPGQGGQPVGVPVRVSVEASVSGLDLGVVVEKDKELNGGDVTIVLGIIRSAVTKSMVIFSMVLLWILTATVVVMAVLVLRGRKLEMVMFPFAGTILFSMLVFRNALPGAPPIGCLSDYLAFFWGYAFVTLALVAFTVTWVRRRDT